MLELLQAKGFLTLSRNAHPSVNNAPKFTLDNGVAVNIYGPGVIEFTPKLATSCHSIVLSCGVHGNETAPIEICESIVKELLHGRLHLLHRVLFIFGNLPAMDIAQRFVHENMNRLFCGEHALGDTHNYERDRAKFLENCMERFFLGEQESGLRLHYDLHTAIRDSKHEKFAVYPYLHGKAYSRSQLKFLSLCGVNTILLSQSTTATFSYYSSKQFNAHSFTVELGKVKPFGENDMSKFTKVNKALRLLLGAPGLPGTAEIEDMVIYQVNQVINKQTDGFKLNFADDSPNFSEFVQGEVIAKETDRIYIAQCDGEAIVFPNAKVPIGQRALLTVVPVALDTLKVSN